MTWDTERAKAGRRPFRVVECDLDYCALEYGINGLHLYVIGNGNDKVYQYDLGTAQDLSTAVYAGAGNDLSVTAKNTLPRGVCISADGKHLYFVGSTATASIFSYTLGTAFDLSTAVYDTGADLDVSGQDLTPYGLCISHDGLHLYMVGDNNNKVHQYDLSTAWDLSTAVYAGAGNDLSVAAQDGNPAGVAIGKLGTRLYVAGRANNKVYQYNLTTAYDLSTAAYSAGDDLDASGQDTFVEDVTVSADGLKIYVLGNTNNKVYQYDLGTAHDLSTAVYSATDDLDVSAQDGEPWGVCISAGCAAVLGAASPANDHKCFNTRVSCQDTDNYLPELKTYRFCDPVAEASRAFDAVPSLRDVDMAPAQIDPGRSLGKRASVTLSFQDHPHHDRGIDKYYAERISGAAAADSSTYTPYEQGSYFGKLRARNPYYAGRALRLYTGFLPWDHTAGPDAQPSESEATVLASLRRRDYLMERWTGPDADGNFRITAKDTLKLADDDRALCPAPSTGTLAAELVATVFAADGDTFDAEPSAGTYDTYGIWFRADGLKFYACFAIASRHVLAYTLSSAWDVTTASYDGAAKDLDASAEIGAGGHFQGLVFNPAGTVVICVDASNGRFRRYTLGTAWDLSTASYDATGATIIQIDSFGIAANDDGTKLYVATGTGLGYAELRQYDVSVGWTGAIAYDSSKSLHLRSPQDATLRALQFANGGQRLLVVFTGTEWFTATPVALILRFDFDTPYDINSGRYAGESHDTVLTDTNDTPTGLAVRADSPQLFVMGDAGTATVLYSFQVAQPTVDLSPAGIGASEYPASGTVKIGDELIAFTRSSDTLTLLERGSDNSEISAHSLGDTVQLCKRFVAARIDTVIADLLENFANVDAAYLPTADWSTEAAAYLPTHIYDTVIAEPTGVAELITEIMQDSLCYIWWDEIDQEIKFRAIRQAASVATLTGDNAIIERAFRSTDTPEDRVTHVDVYYGRLNPIVQLDEPVNFRKLSQAIDTAAESALEYGDQRVRTIYSRWLGRGHTTEADLLASTLLTQYRDNPVDFDMTLGAKDADVWTGDVVTIQHRAWQGLRGEALAQRAQVLEVEETEKGQFRYKLRTDIFAEP